MSSLQDLRKNRLKNDYQEMQKLLSSAFQWNTIKGNAPYVEEYRLNFQARVIIGPKPNYRSHHQLDLILPATYPFKAGPMIYMRSKPFPFHPNWYPQDGLWCSGKWNYSESLGRFAIRMLKSLLYDPIQTEPNDPAFRSAKDWYLRNQSQSLFPSDGLHKIPMLDIESKKSKKFNIR